MYFIPVVVYSVLCDNNKDLDPIIQNAYLWFAIDIVIITFVQAILIYHKKYILVDKKMKPESWIIEDIRLMRQNKERTSIENSYLDLLLWYVKVLNEKE